MYMKAFIKIFTLFSLSAAFTACNKNAAESGEPGRTIRLWAGEAQDSPKTRAEETGFDRSLQPLFVFWTSGNFDNGAAGAPHFFTRIPEGVINDYQATPYNTQVYYPNNDVLVSVIGLAPAPGEGWLIPATEGSLAAFNVVPGDGTTDDTYGVRDILVAGKQVGSSSAPLVSSFENRLVFQHALTKLSFKATLAETMTKYVKFVNIQFPSELTPAKVEWDAFRETYVPTAGDEPFVFGHYWTDDGTTLSPSDRRNETFFYQLSKTETESLGYTLILPPGDHMDIIVQYRVADNMDDFDTRPLEEIRLVELPVRISFKDSWNNPLSLGAGDAYEITMRLDLHDIELIGQSRPWEDGGFVPVPIYPTR